LSILFVVLTASASSQQINRSFFIRRLSKHLGF